MGDVLCKWRMPKVEHVVELVQELPKEEMAENEFDSDRSIHHPQSEDTSSDSPD